MSYIISLPFFYVYKSTIPIWCNIVVILELVLPIFTWIYWTSCRTKAVGTAFAPLLLNHWSNGQNLASLTLLNLGYFERGSSELAELFPLPLFWQYSNLYSDKFMTLKSPCLDRRMSIPTFPNIAWVWNFLCCLSMTFLWLLRFPFSFPLIQQLKLWVNLSFLLFCILCIQLPLHFSSSITPYFTVVDPSLNEEKHFFNVLASLSS